MKLSAFILCLFFSTLKVGAQGTYDNIFDEPTPIGVSGKLAGAVTLSYIPGEDENHYKITYHNLDSPDYYEPETLSLYGSAKDLEELYNFLKKGFTVKESRTMEVGNNEKIMVDYAYSSIRIAVLRRNGLNSLFFLSRKQLDRLFNKD